MEHGKHFLEQFLETMTILLIAHEFKEEMNLALALGGQLLLGKQFVENSEKLLVFQT
jgi:hypothetical protein